MNTVIKVLVENTTPRSPLLGEYGFSAQVLVDGHNILFDTGSHAALFSNSRALGVDLSQVQDLFISHGHYDHTGAVLPFLQQYGGRNIYAHSGIFAHRLVNLPGGKQVDIGCRFTRDEAIKMGAQVIPIDSFSEIYSGIYLTGEIPRLTEYEDVGGNFVYEKDGKLYQDSLPDDIALVIDHPEGLIILSGCSHSGMINTLDYCLKQTGRTRVLAYMGGTHLMTASPLRLEKTIEALKIYEIQKIIVGHCTGFYAAAELYNQLGGQRVFKMDVGSSFSF
ncbi:MAG: MBL fold metallo-hydrolase [Syntrophomonadaceae bacterium]|nr:MBL fold metallo-hydrolase [Syntrophomonadaceae bacterium]